MEAKFCPFCQRKNKNNAVRCEHCGVMLISQKPEIHTTVGISEVSLQDAAEVVSCSQRIEHFPEDCFALFIMDFGEPIIVSINPVITLGRDDNKEAERNVVDFSRFGDMTLGISRKHAAIYFENNEFRIEDLGSTNGTWLNKHRLMPGKSQRLKNDDQIWLGPLKMVFCLGSNEPKNAARFWLTQQSHGRKSRTLSPNRLTKQIGPYLEALVEVDHIKSACLGLQENEISIVSLIQRENGLEVKLSSNPETTTSVQKRLNRWRLEHQDQG
jgi:pSer/pThr/pTyr-binding forkhead associated (FHA) protein